ncbi:MAG: MATE family efflux transporter [Bacteroidia bacterium]|nr:MAG: MATE family efflux transporter [Bacteroidia bacterium]
MSAENTYRSIWKTAYPIVVGLMAQNLMVVIDTAFLGRLGEITLGASAIGGIFYLCLVMLGAGFAVGVQIVIGRRNGEGNKTSIGLIFDHAMYFVIALAGLLFLVLTYLAPGFLQWFLKSEGVLRESLIYLDYRRFGFLFGFMVLIFNSFYVGITRTRILIASTSLMAAINIALDYVLIFGHFGAPAMGIAGAAMATNIAEACTFLFFLLWSIKNKTLPAYRLLQFHRPNRLQYKPLLKVAVPVMFQYFFSFSAWFVFFLVIEQIGETALAASNITRSFYMLLMIPVWGLSSATNTLVSNIIGQGRSHEVIPLIKKVLVIALLSTIVIVQVNLFIPGHIASFFTNEQHLIDATIPLLRVISLALFAFAFGMIIFSGLSGTGKTLVALVIEIFSITFYLVSAFIIAVWLKGPAALVWSVEVIYFTMMGLGSLAYLRTGKWKIYKF